MAMGVLAVAFALAPPLRDHPDLPDGVAMASSLIVVAMVLDGLDGAVARLFGGSPLGRRLDSASDFVSFCLAPGALVAAAYWARGEGLGGAGNLACLLVAALFAMAGLKRLWDFTNEGHRHTGFTGLATPAAAFAAVVMVHVLPRGSEFLQGYPDPLLQLGILALVALHMVAPVRYPKVTGVVGAALAGGFIASIGYLALRKTIWPLPEEELYPQYNFLRFLALGIILLYIVGGALFGALTEKK
jgi:CDP-diacylglycerol--serine O-phosphatidyltransferase